MIFFGDTQRCERLGRYIVESGATVREAAGHFRISKSTVHKDVRTVLYTVNRSLWEEVAAVLEKNKSERHLRGGAATKQKYQEKKERINSSVRKFDRETNS